MCHPNHDLVKFTAGSIKEYIHSFVINLTNNENNKKIFHTRKM